MGITHCTRAVGQAAGVPRSDGQTARAAKKCHIGDDLIDWPVMAEVASVAVADAHPLLLPRANHVTRFDGRGAVREVLRFVTIGAGQVG